ncbi:MAG: hypothetical protein JKY48_18100 [Flavobacteriales bacterium]|nr:hypothetical protein [Flavobacteriales bacterium]
MPQATFISWNIQNFSSNKAKADFYEVITQVTYMLNADFTGLMEIQSNCGDAIGEQITGRLPWQNNVPLYVYQDTDRYTRFSDQHLAYWNTQTMGSTAIQYNDFTDANGNPLEFPNDSYRPPMMISMTVSGMPLNIVLYHAPGPGDTPNVYLGTQNIAQIPAVQTCANGVVMGDFNVSPNNPATSPNAANTFNPLLNLQYNQLTVGLATTLVGSVTNPNATYNDCVNSQYDNFFYKNTQAGVQLTAEVIDMFAPCIQGNQSYYANYDILLRTWVAKKQGWVGQVNPIYNYQDAFNAYSAVSNHLPIKLTVAW